MREVIFSFGPATLGTFRGFTDGKRWNGFAVIYTTPDEAREIVGHWRGLMAKDDSFGLDQSIDDLRVLIQRSETAGDLVSLNGYSCVEIPEEAIQ